MDSKTKSVGGGQKTPLCFLSYREREKYSLTYPSIGGEDKKGRTLSVSYPPCPTLGLKMGKKKMRFTENNPLLCIN